MKLRCTALLALGFLAITASAQDATAPAGPKTPKDKMSYAIGVQVAMSLKSQGIDIDPNVVASGFKDALSGGKLLMTEAELNTTLTALQDQLRQKQAEMLSKMAEDNKKAGDAFFAENAKKEGVVTLPSGLQYKILKAGQGSKPAVTDTVSCNYRGTLIDGTEFDSSLPSGKPATFQINGVIPGFKEALQLMPVGSKWQVFIPSGLAYGTAGAGNAIGPNAALIFEIELVSIQGKPAVMP